MAVGTQMGAKVTDHAGDTEITLSTGKLLGIFFALAIVCGVFFTMGYLLGKSASTGGRTEIVGSVPANNNASTLNAGPRRREAMGPSPTVRSSLSPTNGNDASSRGHMRHKRCSAAIAPRHLKPGITL